MTEKKWYLRCPLPKRWHVDGQNVQSVIEIFAEAPCLHRFLNINVCCGQHAHVGLDQVPPAQTRILVILQHVKQFCLQVRAHFRDFVQEDCALIGHFKLSWFAAHRARERALLEPEKLRFQKFAWQGRAIHLHKRLVAPLRAQMNHSRNNFFAHAALPTNKNGHIDGRDLQDLLADPHHLRTGCEEAQVLGHLVAVIAQSLILGRQLLLLPRLQHCCVQLRFLEGFGQIIVCPDSDGFDDCAYFVRARKHDDVEAAVHLHQFLQCIQAIHLRHQHIQDDEIGTLTLVHSLEGISP